MKKILSSLVGRALSCRVLFWGLNESAFLFFGVFVLCTCFPASKINSAYSVLARGMVSRDLWD